MSAYRTFKFTALAAAALALAACSSPEQPLEPINTRDTSGVSLPGSRSVETPAKIMSDYSLYRSALEAVKRNDDVLPAQFLSQAGSSAMAETVRNEWLESLGRRGQWPQFQQQDLPCSIKKGARRKCNAMPTISAAARARWPMNWCAKSAACRKAATPCSNPPLPAAA